MQRHFNFFSVFKIVSLFVTFAIFLTTGSFQSVHFLVFPPSFPPNFITFKISKINSSTLGGGSFLLSCLIG